MGVDVLILNTGVVDFRGREFEFAGKLAGPGGLAKGRTDEMPAYSQNQIECWIKSGKATAGGPGNCAPLIAKAGLKVAVGVNLGKGDFEGLDIHGRFFYNSMTAAGIDMSATYVHPSLPTGATFIYEKQASDRGGLVYFPNANNDFDFEYYKKHLRRLKPAIVYYMYSGLSDRGDANGGRDLAEFLDFAGSEGAITIIDSHTLSGNPEEIIQAGRSVKEYSLLEPLLGRLDIFFTSHDEARMIENTIGEKNKSKGISKDDYISHFLDFLAQRFWRDNNKTRIFGVTVADGAFIKYAVPGGKISKVNKVRSDFMSGEVVDLVGAGDSFRAGVITYVAKNIEQFKAGTINFSRAVSMGNLFASLYIKSPLNNRYGNIGLFEKMLGIITGGKRFDNFEGLIAAIKS